MKKQMGLSRSLWKKIILAQLSISLAFGIYGCDSEKMTVEKKQKVENESTEIQQESEGEKMRMTTTEMEKIFESVLPEKAYKEIGNHNPVMTQRFGADPYAMVYDGRVYLYMTCDEPMLDENGEILENDYSNIYKINVISSADLVNWTDHGHKHFPDKNKPWKDTTKSTKNGPAKYSPDIKDIEAFERETWEIGTPVTNGKNWKVKKYDEIIGATGGKETQYVRIENSANTIHGHPISESEYLKLLK